MRGVSSWLVCSLVIRKRKYLRKRMKNLSREKPKLSEPCFEKEEVQSHYTRSYRHTKKVREFWSAIIQSFEWEYSIFRVCHSGIAQLFFSNSKPYLHKLIFCSNFSVFGAKGFDRKHAKNKKDSTFVLFWTNRVLFLKIFQFKLEIHIFEWHIELKNFEQDLKIMMLQIPKNGMSLSFENSTW